MYYRHDHHIHVPVRMSDVLGNHLFIFMLLIIVVVQAFPFDPFLNDIPSDENEAAVLLEAHELDSAVWLSLEPLYRHPLQVPYGELALLQDIFPETGNHLPVQSDELNRYLPWNDEAIERFFTDYPMMRHFKPVIQFRYRETRNPGNIAFFLHNVDDEAASVNFARSMVQFDKVRFGGSLEVATGYARWDRRSIAFLPVPQCKIIAGNQRLFPDNGLLYGYFPVDKRCSDNKKFNWLYGASPTWNGIGINLSLRDTNRASPALGFFLHRRPSERIFGGGITVNPTDVVTGFIGVTGMEPDNTSSAQFFIHGSFNFTANNFSSEMTCVFDGRHLHKVPFTMENRFRRDEYSLHLTIMHFPASFSAPRSALLLRFRDDMDIDDMLSPAITFLRVNTGDCVSSREVHKERLHLWPQVNIWLYGGAIHHGKVILNGKKRCAGVDVTVKFGHEFGREKSQNKYAFEGDAVWRISDLLSIKTSHTFYYSDYAGRRYHGTMQTSLLMASGLKIEPVVKIIMQHQSLYSVAAGYRQKVTLFKRTFTELYAEKGLRISKGEYFYHVAGNASFQF
jgi:hypothetical protein